MSAPRELDPGKLAAEALTNAGRVPLALLLGSVLGLHELREIARRHDLKLKGFRIERAPADRVAKLIAESDQPVVQDACEVLVEVLRRDEPATEPSASEDSVPRAVHDHKLKELEQAKADVDRGKEQLARFRDMVDELRRELALERENLARSTAQVRELERELAETPKDAPSRDDHLARAHELQRDLDALAESESGLRRLLALRDTRLREAEATIAELEELVPKGRRRRKPKPIEDEPRERFRVPWFTDGFYKSLDGKDRASVERAFRAVFLFCTEGPAYPGLEVKQIEGQDLWSLRASLKLRVYFRMRDDGDVDLVALADREDQRTALRRLKDR